MGSVNMTDALRSFCGKRVFITGHTGFKGTWLTFILKALHAEVMGYALGAEKGSHFELLELEPQIRHVAADVRDRDQLERAVREFEPEYVFHLAAQALVKASYRDPVATFEVNLGGSVNLLEAVRKCPSVRSLVYITSDKCYENVEWVWGYRECDRLGGHDPYSASKAAAELAFSAYARSFFASRPELGAASTRAGNVIGGGDWAADRIIPDCIRAIQHNIPVRLRNPNATRPWQHVLEPISGYLLLASRLRDDPHTFAGAWNFGPSGTDVRTVFEIANRIVREIGRGDVEVHQSDQHAHEARLLQLNCDKAHQLLGWYPRWSVDRTLSATAVWYKALMNGEDIKRVTCTQVREYFPELP